MQKLKKSTLQGSQRWEEMMWLDFISNYKRQNLHFLFSSPSLWHMQLLVSEMLLFFFFVVIETCTLKEPMSHINTSNDRELVKLKLIKLPEHQEDWPNHFLEGNFNRTEIRF